MTAAGRWAPGYVSEAEDGIFVALHHAEAASSPCARENATEGKEDAFGVTTVTTSASTYSSSSCASSHLLAGRTILCGGWLPGGSASSSSVA